MENSYYSSFEKECQRRTEKECWTKWLSVAGAKTLSLATLSTRPSFGTVFVCERVMLTLFAERGCWCYKNEQASIYSISTIWRQSTDKLAVYRRHSRKSLPFFSSTHYLSTIFVVSQWLSCMSCFYLYFQHWNDEIKITSFLGFWWKLYCRRYSIYRLYWHRTGFEDIFFSPLIFFNTFSLHPLRISLNSKLN